MESNKPLSDESEIDRLLSHAQWPEPRIEQIARLRDSWRSIARRRRLRFVYGALAMAASILVVVGIVASRKVGSPSTAGPVARSERAKVAGAKNQRASEPLRPLRSQPPASISSTAQPKPAGSSIQPRDANLYEQVVLTRRPSQREPNRRAPANTELDKSRLEELIVALGSDPRADVDERLDSVQNHLARYERLLWDVVSRGTPERRLGAARIISRIGTAQSLPILTDLMNDPTTREAAIVGLGRLASTADLTRLVTVESKSELRRNLLMMLLARRTEESVGLYLDFVNEQSFRPDALAAVATMADPPVDLLLGFLESSRKTVRLAAAQALGRLPDTDIAERLSTFVFRGIGRQEALVALLLSPNAQAATFLNQARQNLYLVASVQAAEQQLHSLTIPERR